MRILHCNTNENEGGAAIAARRLHLGLLAAGVESRLAVVKCFLETPQLAALSCKLARLFALPALNKLESVLAGVFYARPEHPAYATFSLLPSLQYRHINALQKDILHLHWVNGGLLSPWDIACLRSPVVWTMHDTWPFTGGCHYQSTGCERYLERCGRCPELGSCRERDISRLHWLLKRKAMEKIRPVMISPSRDYARRAVASALLRGCRVEYIPNGIDAEVFRPLDKTLARNLLGLPPKENIVLFGAMSATSDHNKGFDLLCRALHLLAANGQHNFLPVIFGATESDAQLPLAPRFLGRLHDPLTLALTYSAADIFICPSRQENLPNTIMESMACGTPVVAFPVGGIPDVVEQGVSGWLASPQEAEDLARGIALLLSDAELRKRMGVAGREKVEREFAMPVIARLYTALYEDVLKKQGA